MALSWQSSASRVTSIGLKFAASRVDCVSTVCCDGCQNFIQCKSPTCVFSSGHLLPSRHGVPCLLIRLLLLVEDPTVAVECPLDDTLFFGFVLGCGSPFRERFRIRCFVNVDLFDIGAGRSCKTDAVYHEAQTYEPYAGSMKLLRLCNKGKLRNFS